jgi:histidyl-tRNA synthetase
VEIRLNHCALFKGILQRCGVPEELHAEIKNKLLEPNGQTDWMDLRQVHDINKLQDYLRRKGGKGLLRDLEHDEELMTYPEVDMQRVIDDLTHFLHLCEEKGVPTEQCVFHLNLVQELDYYDGLMFQAVHVPGMYTIACTRTLFFLKYQCI